MHSQVSGKNMHWHHLSQVDEEDLQFLQETFQFHYLDYEDIRSERRISKLDVYKHYVFMTFHLPFLDERGRVIGEPLHVFLSADNLITISQVKIPTIERFFRSCSKNTKFCSRWMQKGTSFFLYKLLVALFQESFPLVTKLVKETDDVEEQVYGRRESSVTVRLGRLRRNVLFLRHLIDPQRHMFINLSGLNRPFLSKDMEIYYDDIRDLLDTIWMTADNLKLIIDGLFDVNEALTSHRTNQIITLFTILTTALTGPMFLAAFYGMNVDWLPYMDRPLVMASFFVGSLMIILTMVYFILRRRPQIRYQ